MNKNIQQKNKWYCYLCGKILKNNYYLWSMRKETDRVFLCCYNCVNQIPNECIIIKVKEFPKEKKNESNKI